MMKSQIATTMGFMGHELAVNPDVQAKLFEEITNMNEDLNGKIINYEQIQGLKYLDQVVCETLRKWPAAPVSAFQVALKNDDNIIFCFRSQIEFVLRTMISAGKDKTSPGTRTHHF